MKVESSTNIACPYCGEKNVFMIDCCAGSQKYIEECQVCCRPINVIVEIDPDGEPIVEARHEDDAL